MTFDEWLDEKQTVNTRRDRLEWLMGQPDDFNKRQMLMAWLMSAWNTGLESGVPCPRDEVGLRVDGVPLYQPEKAENLKRPRDKNGYEIVVRRVEWVHRMGWIGDSEGRTWAKELYAEAKFPTREAAELHQEHHPDCFKDPWGQLRTKYPYGQIGIFCVETEVYLEMHEGIIRVGELT